MWLLTGHPLLKTMLNRDMALTSSPPTEKFGIPAN